MGSTIITKLLQTKEIEKVVWALDFEKWVRQWQEGIGEKNIPSRSDSQEEVLGMAEGTAMPRAGVRKIVQVGCV